MMDDRIIQPATEAREYLKPIKKVLKKRDDKRLDFERYEDRVNHATKKGQKSERDVLALQKAQEEFAKATDVSHSEGVLTFGCSPFDRCFDSPTNKFDKFFPH